ncbi:MAG: flagellar protein FlaG [bacterium]
MRASLEEAVARLNEQARRSARNLNFSIDEVVDRTVITVRSSQTGEVVRQIPNEVVLKLAHHLESMKGLIFDGSV